VKPRCRESFDPPLAWPVAAIRTAPAPSASRRVNISTRSLEFPVTLEQRQRAAVVLECRARDVRDAARSPRDRVSPSGCRGLR
jgi:hypothetical protein